MQVILAGGSGTIGNALARELIQAGHQVIVLSRNPQRVTVPSGVRLSGWDAYSAEGWGCLVEECDAIVNLAGENLAAGRWTEERWRRIVDSRLAAGWAVTEAVQAAKCKPRLVIQASAVGYYGRLDDRIVTEESPAGSDRLANICLDWEASSRKVEEVGVRWIAVRTGIVISRQSQALKPLLLQYRLFAGGPLGSGKQWWSWITLSDEVGAIRFLLENEGSQGVYNLTAPNPLPMDDFGRTLGIVLKRPHRLPVPAFALKVAFGEMSTILLDGQRVLPKRLLEAGYSFQYPELRGALEAILK